MYEETAGKGTYQIYYNNYVYIYVLYFPYSFKFRLYGPPRLE